jgi:hypothetical protein
MYVYMHLVVCVLSRDPHGVSVTSRVVLRLSKSTTHLVFRDARGFSTRGLRPDTWHGEHRLEGSLRGYSIHLVSLTPAAYNEFVRLG